MEISQEQTKPTGLSNADSSIITYQEESAARVTVLHLDLSEPLECSGNSACLRLVGTFTGRTLSIPVRTQATLNRVLGTHVKHQARILLAIR